MENVSSGDVAPEPRGLADERPSRTPESPAGVAGTGDHPASFEHVFVEEIRMLGERRKEWRRMHRPAREPGSKPAVDPNRRFVQEAESLIKAIEAEAKSRATAAEAAQTESDAKTDGQGRTTAEKDGLHPDEDSAAVKLRRLALENELAGLSLSGGGIRSASVCLGVVQTLSELRLLSRFDYLSTVSGGGYLGSWLTALLDRETREDATRSSEDPRGVFRVEQELGNNNDFKERHDSEREHRAIRFLRSYSNYLTPRVGLTSLDTWTMVATYLRNFGLNLLLLVASAGALLVVPRLLAVIAQGVDVGGPSWVPYPLFGLLFFAVFFVCRTVTRGMASLRSHAIDTRGEDVHTVLAYGVTAAVFSVWIFSVICVESDSLGSRPFYWWMVWTAAASIFAWLLTWWNSRSDSEELPASSFRYGLYWTLAGAGSGALLGPLLGLLAESASTGRLSSYWLATMWIPPAVLLWLVALGALQTGLAGRALQDAQREWLNRFGAWLMIAALLWAGLFGLIIYGPVVILGLGTWAQVALTGGWLATTLGGVLSARSESGDSRIGKLLIGVAPPVFVLGFLLGVILLLDLGVDRAARHLEVAQDASWSDVYDTVCDVKSHSAQWHYLQKVSPPETVSDRPKVWTPIFEEHLRFLEAPIGAWLSTLTVWAILILASWVLSRQIDINEFSMHGFYRNRLVRAYLGASNPQRMQNQVTGFSLTDDLSLSELWPGKDADLGDLPKPPIHLINTAINLVSTEELAWQQRKAGAFLVSPLYCGFDDRRQSTKDSPGGYRPTKEFATSHAPLTLGDAVATSGAAASPNMGFRSSGAMAALLTLFNVRLGRWVGNPKRNKWKKSCPRFALRPLWDEFRANTSSDHDFVYLSDGGHFENLGIYELVRRRCRLIIAVDAGADPDYSFDDLGNAIRKCRIDQRVKIEIDPSPIRPGVEGTSHWHCAVGRILYPEDLSRPGLLLLIKSSITGDEPADVLEYRSVENDFPHQTTGDQFFDESQFESHRVLGRHIAGDVLTWAVERSSIPFEQDRPQRKDWDWPPTRRLEFERLLIHLQHRWHPPSIAAEGAFTRHAATLDQLFRRARSDDKLAFMDAQCYPEWLQLTSRAERPDDGTEESVTARPDHLDAADESAGPATAVFQEGRELQLPATEEEIRAGFYFCNSLIQLMENVYLDLRLDSEHAHPDNSGWMNLFRHWSWSSMLRATWAVSAATYGRRFRMFCREHLDLTLGEVEAAPLWDADDSRALEVLGNQLAESSREGSFLNYVEAGHVRVLFESMEKPEVKSVGPHEIEQVYALRLEVPGLPRDSKIMFGVGYAVVGRWAADGPRRVLLFRIQDHLRKQQLGRAGLRALLDHDERSRLKDERTPICLAKGPSASAATSPQENDRPLDRLVERIGTIFRDREAPALVESQAPKSKFVNDEITRHFVSEFRNSSHRFERLFRSVVAARPQSQEADGTHDDGQGHDRESADREDCQRS